jgi:hypothetical protein
MTSGLLTVQVKNEILRRVLSVDLPSHRGRPRSLSTVETLGRILYICRTGCQWSQLPLPAHVSYKTVAYDPQKPAETLTASVLSSESRMTIEIALGVVLALVVLFFVLNLALRKNRTWQNVSGVMEGADIASALFRR